MAAKTDKKTNSTLPLNTEDPTPSSNITYNSEVVAIIAGLAANEVEGIAGMCSVSGSIMSKNRNVTKGVKVKKLPLTFMSSLNTVFRSSAPQRTPRKTSARRLNP